MPSYHIVTEHEFSYMLTDCFVQLRELMGDDRAADAVDEIHELLASDDTRGVLFTDAGLQFTLAANSETISDVVGAEYAAETIRIVRHTLTDEFYHTQPIE